MTQESVGKEAVSSLYLRKSIGKGQISRGKRRERRKLIFPAFLPWANSFILLTVRQHYAYFADEEIKALKGLVTHPRSQLICDYTGTGL